MPWLPWKCKYRTNDDAAVLLCLDSAIGKLDVQGLQAKITEAIDAMNEFVGEEWPPEQEEEIAPPDWMDIGEEGHSLGNANTTISVERAAAAEQNGSTPQKTRGNDAKEEDATPDLTEDEAGWAMPSESEDLTFDQANAHSSGGHHNRKETEQETEVIRWLHCNFQDMCTAETVESMYSNYRQTLVQTRRDLPRGRPGAIVSKGEFARIVRKTFPNYHFCGKPGSDRSKKT